MDALVRTFFVLRVVASRGAGLLLVAAFASALVVLGTRNEVLAFGGAVALFVLVRAVRRRWRESVLSELEVGTLLASLVYAGLLGLEGGLDGLLSASIFVLIAWMAALSRPATSFFLALFVSGLEGALRHRAGMELASAGFLSRLFFVVLFACESAVLLRAQAARMRHLARVEVDEEIGKLREEARSYRLLGAGEERAAAREERLERSSVEEIHQSVHYALELLRRTLGLHTAVLLWKNDAGTHFRISELSSGAEDVNDAPIPVGDGVLAVADRRAEAVAMEGLRPSYKVPYYAGSCPVRALAVLPIFEEQKEGKGASAPRAQSAVRGLLAIDRLENRAFTQEEQELAAQAARYCHRAIQNERVFLQLERAKVEQGKLYRAAQALGAAQSEQEVLEAGVRAAREIASFDLAAVTVFDDAQKRHEVVAALGTEPAFQELVGASFRHNTGLVSMVVQNRFPLPYRGEFDAEHQVVLTKRFPWPDLPSLLVLPLMLRDRPLGTLILGSKRRHAFGDSVRHTLEVLASHLAVSLSNARMVQKLETMATTDGLTGLLNKRAMLEQGAQKIEASSRFGRKLSLLVTDIDHFKKVNDTYGHDVGDVVIKGLGDILRRQKRATDLVARFGGEEFVVVCEQTDEAGAWLLAERIREELGRTSFQTPAGPVNVTCSIGIATFPEAARDWDTLFKAADDALYVSKRGGRNRCTLWHQRSPASAPVPAAPKSSKPSRRVG